MVSYIEKEKKYEYVAYILLFLCTIIWGGTWPLGRWLVSEDVGGETIPPMMIATIRYFLVIPFFFIIMKLKEDKLNIDFVKKEWKIFALMGITSVTIYQAGYLIGEYYTAASDASVMVSTLPVWVIIISTIVLRTESLSLWKIIGALMAFSGVLLVAGFSPNVNVPNRILGDLLILIGALSYAIYTVTSRIFLSKCENGSYQPTSLYILAWVSFFGFMTTLPVSLIINPEYLNPTLYFQIPERVWYGIAYLSFLSTLMGYWFYLEGVKRLTASRAAIFQNLVPIFGIIFSAIFLDEIIDPIIHVTAILLILSGITLVNQTK